ncbi:MAG: type II toxin-antitoxin system VapC family toxin [Firmicutes bacterium]|jgi:PIN domain nuclease of toxin-antitoxin system|nr:type II toxin-antitoxin system VapC family toxin [Bacillota bacterium]
MYLLDTCAFLWFLDDNARLSAKACDAIGKSKNLYLSIASLWEIAIKKTLNKLDIEESITELENTCYCYGIMILPIRTRYLERIQQLPMIHGDPFDRLIMSTALEENLRLITHDEKISKYDIELFW